MVEIISGDDIVLIDVNKIELHPDNPNQQSDKEFNLLLEEIEQDGFDEPVLVVPHPDEAKAAVGMYQMVAGAHRLMAMQTLGEAKIPAIIKSDWDEAQARIKTVRRNMISGSLDKAKFGELVRKLNSENGVDMVDMPEVLGFTKMQEFEKMLAMQLSDDDDQYADAQDEDMNQNPGTVMVDNMLHVLNEILSQFGDTIPNGFVFFFYKNQFHLMVTEDAALQGEIDHLANYLRQSHGDMAQFFTDAIHEKLDKIRDESGSDPRDVPQSYSSGKNVSEISDVSDMFD